MRTPQATCENPGHLRPCRRSPRSPATSSARWQQSPVLRCKRNNFFFVILVCCLRLNKMGWIFEFVVFGIFRTMHFHHCWTFVIHFKRLWVEFECYAFSSFEMDVSWDGHGIWNFLDHAFSRIFFISSMNLNVMHLWVEMGMLLKKIHEPWTL